MAKLQQGYNKAPTCSRNQKGKPLALYLEVSELPDVKNGTHLMASRPRFNAVVSDMDGLLLDTERIAHATFLEACGKMGIGDETEVFKLCIGLNKVRGKQVLAEGLAGKADPAAFGEYWYQRYLEETAKAIPLLPGAVELLHFLDASGIPIAVATSSSTAQAHEKLGQANVLKYIQSIVGGDQVEHSKPHPEIYLKAAASLGVSPNDCLALEDSENGVRSAVAAGMQVIQVPDFVEPSEDLLKLEHQVSPDLIHILDWIKSYRRQAH